MVVQSKPYASSPDKAGVCVECQSVLSSLHYLRPVMIAQPNHRALGRIVTKELFHRASPEALFEALIKLGVNSCSQGELRLAVR
jgi:hypothetical protein